MRIAIVGCGAMGCLFGGYLAAGGHEVTMVDRRPDRCEWILKNGLKIDGVAGERSAHPRCVLDATQAGESEIVLVMVKAYDTRPALKQHRALFGGGAFALTLQNGMGNLAELERVVGPDRVLGGITTVGAFTIEPGVIRHAGSGDTLIGAPHGREPEILAELVEALTQAGIPTSIDPNVERLIWEKLIVNAAINPITALSRQTNGVLLEREEAGELAGEIVDECLLVARGCGHDLDRDRVLERVFQVARNTAKNRSSMLMDVLNGRRTEIGWISGAIVRMGREQGVDTHVNRTICRLIQMLESGNPAVDEG